MPNVKFFFNHKLTGADFIKNRAWFEVRPITIATDSVGTFSGNKRAAEIEVAFDFLIGADGAHSATRYHLMKFTRVNYCQDYIDTLWCEFQIPPKRVSSDAEDKFRISKNHLHIWPGKEHMFIAIPSLVSVYSFPSHRLESLTWH
jgi:kynurenine 3-monooxygenase